MRTRWLPGLLLLSIGLLGAARPVTPARSLGNRIEHATLGGGCFWCMDAIFRELRGVDHVDSGFSGGHVPNPTYREVCTGTTGHAEVVDVTFEPKVISYRDLLRVFFTLHDPTTLDRQGEDVGTQYRSVVFFRTPEQEHVAWSVIREFERAHVWRDPIVTAVEPFRAFYRAENYHQDYYESNGSQPYCRIVIAPKVAKLRKLFLARLKAPYRAAH